ncbi:MAG TPA: ion channel [Acidimicrobiia bacterium]|nr:ion channel [Acidimicrobiia bacterium]
MTYGAHTEPSRIETWLEARMPGYRYGAVLVLLAMTFIVMAAGPPDGYTRVITVTLQGLTLMASLLASRVSRRLFRVAAIVTLLAFIAALVSVILGTSDEGSGVFFVLNVLLVATVPVVIARALWRRGTVDIHTVMGAICIYVLLGMMFAFVYAAIDALSSGPFFVQTAHPTAPDFLYFSFITQTTVGYGDFTASGDLGRALAVLEALTGQLYLVTIIAVLVSRLSGRARPANGTIEMPAPPPGVDTPEAAQTTSDPSA